MQVGSGLGAVAGIERDRLPWCCEAGMRRLPSIGLALAGALAAFVYINNTSLLSAPHGGRPTLVAHRGLHQTFPPDGLKADTCTATRIHPPEHGFLENTIASMQAAFEAGADVVELDVHPTIDGHFAVFHDWTLDCRTDGKGVTRERTLAELKALDIGHGYTADGGKAYPFRGRGWAWCHRSTRCWRPSPSGDC